MIDFLNSFVHGVLAIMLDPGPGMTKWAYIRAYTRGELDDLRGLIYEFSLG